MMNKTISRLIAVAAVSVLPAACAFERSSSEVLSPAAPSGLNGGGGGSNSSTQSFLGTWASQSLTQLPSAASCANFQWRVTSQTATTLAGDFSAVCAGNVTVNGSAAGQLNGTMVPMTANGSATVPGLPACNFSLNGTGNIENSDAIRIDYTGNTCFGPVHGSETLRRAAPAPAPAPTPAPAPEPTPPPPPDDPLFGCGGIQDKMDLVDCIHGHIQPHDQYGAFEVAKRVAWALRGEGAGLLIKNGGENIVPWQGYSFAAGRICYPDGHIYKVISDVGPGGLNGPSWQDNGFVDRNLYVPAIDPNR
jgi:hypothetical protein